MSKKGYYWIPPTDYTLNGQEYYNAKIIGDVKYDFKKNRIQFALDKFFPVGSIFHFAGNCFNYIITRRLKMWGTKYEVRREDDCNIGPDDIERFESGRTVHRDGFMHEDI